MDRLRVGIDANFLYRDKRGMGRLVKNLITWIYKLNSSFNFILVSNSWGDSSLKLKNIFKDFNFGYLHARKKYRNYFDLFWFPWARVDYLPYCPRVVGIYDTAPFLYLESNYKKDQKRLEFAAKNADIIVTTSFFSKEAIKRDLDVSAEKIRVVYPGVDETFFQLNLNSDDKKKLKYISSMKEGFWMYVGSHDKRKNIVNLIRAFKIYKEKTKSAKKLVMAGERPKKTSRFAKILGVKDLYDFVSGIGLEGEVLWLGEISDKEMNELYNRAELFVFPSTCEGFGFPVAEAMASGLPAICSDRSSIPEVGGDAVLYFNPEEPSEIANLALKLDKDFALREGLKKSGMLQVKKFKFQNCAEEYIKIFKEAVRR